MKTFITKRLMSTVSALMLFGSIATAQQLLMNENFQDWTLKASYASGSQETTFGTVYYEDIMIKKDYPTMGNRTVNNICTPGYIQVRDGSVITLPEFTGNISKIEIHAYSGTTAKRTFQVLANEAELQTCEIKGSATNGETGEKFEIPVNSTTPTTISLGYANGAIYISDIKVYGTNNGTSGMQHTTAEEGKIICEKYYSLDGSEIMQEYLIQGRIYIKRSMYENGQVQVIKFIK